MFEPEKKSPLDRLQKGLYSRNVGSTEPPRHSIHGEQVRVSESWDKPEQDGSIPPEEAAPVTPERRYAYRIIFICAALFLVATFGIAAYTFFGGGNFISADNVDIQISGPASVAGGDRLALD